MLALLQRFFSQHTLNVDFIAGNLIGTLTTWWWMSRQLKKGKPNETVGKDERV